MKVALIYSYMLSLKFYLYNVLALMLNCYWIKKQILP